MTTICEKAKLFDEEMEVLHVTQDGKFTGAKCWASRTSVSRIYEFWVVPGCCKESLLAKGILPKWPDTWGLGSVNNWTAFPWCRIKSWRSPTTTWVSPPMSLPKTNTSHLMWLEDFDVCRWRFGEGTPSESSPRGRTHGVIQCNLRC